MSIFGTILEKLGMRRPHPTPDIRPLPGRVPAGSPGGAAATPPAPASANAIRAQ